MERRTRKPKWTEAQCLLLARLVDEHKAVLRGEFGPCVTEQTKRDARERKAQQTDASFPLVVRTSEECEKQWYVLQSKARGEIAAFKHDSSHTFQSRMLLSCICCFEALEFSCCCLIIPTDLFSAFSVSLCRNFNKCKTSARE